MQCSFIKIHPLPLPNLVHDLNLCLSSFSISLFLHFSPSLSPSLFPSFSLPIPIKSSWCWPTTTRFGPILEDTKHTKCQTTNKNWLSFFELLLSWGGTSDIVPSSMLVCLELTQILCMLSLSLWVHLCICPLVWKILFLWSFFTTWLLQSFWSLFHIDLRALKEEVW